MKRAAIVLLAAAALAGCGTTTAPQRSKPGQPRTCIHKTPAQIGECLQQEYPGSKPTVLNPFAFGGTQCVDISVWQGVPDFNAARRAGLKCAIVQTNDGSHSNSLFGAQTRALRSAGVPFGVYAFIEAFSGSAQADTSAAIARGAGATLGAWADTEVPGSYGEACGFTARARALGFPIVGVYASPGNYSGGRCDGYIWPAEWGSGVAYPLNGYPASAIKIRQWCGTCRLLGFSGEVDRDESLGLLSLVAAPPKPKPTAAQLHVLRSGLLRRDYQRRSVLRNELTVHRCRVVHGWHAYRLCPGLAREGRAVGADIRRLHRLGIR